MEITKQIAKQLRDTYFGGNWTWVNFKETLDGITLAKATEKVHDFNTIAALLYHMDYYAVGVTEFLNGNHLKTKDKLSWETPEFHSEEEWQNFLANFFIHAENLAKAIEKFPQEKLDEIFHEEIYGNYYRNLHGIIEHCHYHLGQIVLIKKILNQN